jgi:flagellar motility protein MotE (MotC chaperone)
LITHLKFNINLWLLIIGMVPIVVFASSSEKIEDPKPEKKTVSTNPEGEKTSDQKSILINTGCLTDPAALEDIKKAKENNNALQKKLKAKEKELELKEQALNEEFKKIEIVRDQISQTVGAKKKESEEKVAKLVETILTMSPRAAAKMLSTIDDELAVAVVSQMDTQRLAKILNVMEPKRSSKLSEMMAGVVRARSVSVDSQGNVAMSKDVDAITKMSKEGGEKNDGRNERKLNGDQSNQRDSNPNSEPKKGIQSK